METLSRTREEYLRRYQDANLSILPLCSPYSEHKHGGVPCEKRGWGKVPLKRGWQKLADQPMDDRRVQDLLAHTHNYGLAVPSGLIVLDVDNMEAALAVRAELDRLGLKYWLQWTGKGAHFVLLLSAGADVQNWVKKVRVVGREIDLRVKGGQIAVEPSIHPSAKPYIWEPGHSPWDLPRESLSVVPAGLLETSAVPNATPAPIQSDQGIVSGQRNDTLFRLGCSMRTRAFSEEAILAALLKENERCQPPLSAGEVERIAKQAASYEPKHPIVVEDFEERNGEVICRIENFELRARDWTRTADGIRTQLHLENGHGPEARELVTLASSISRGRFLARCPEALREQFEKKLLRLEDYLREKVDKREEPEEAVTLDLTEEDEREADGLLRHPDVLEEFLKDVERLGCMGDDNNKLCLYLAGTSRLLPKPINVTVKAESSAGKNFETESVLTFLPPEAVKILSAMSSKALFHHEGGLKNKVLMIAEAPGAEGADYPIRTMQSEGKITFWVVEKDATGSLKTVEKEVQGPVSIIETTTKTHLHPENETRNFDVYVDESEEQTQRILDADRRARMEPPRPDYKETTLRRWRNAQRLLKAYRVIIPFADQIPFPTHPLRVRRDWGRFMSLIEASAILHQRQREIRVVHGVEHVVADRNDYAVARRIAATILKQILGGATPKCQRLVEAAEQLHGKLDCQAIPRRYIEDELRWDTKTVTKYAKEAMRLGCLEEAESGGGRGHAKSYRFIRAVAEVDVQLPGSDDLKFTMTGQQLYLPMEGLSGFRPAEEK